MYSFTPGPVGQLQWAWPRTWTCLKATVYEPCTSAYRDSVLKEGCSSWYTTSPVQSRALRLNGTLRLLELSTGDPVYTGETSSQHHPMAFRPCRQFPCLIWLLVRRGQELNKARMAWIHTVALFTLSHMASIQGWQPWRQSQTPQTGMEVMTPPFTQDTAGGSHTTLGLEQEHSIYLVQVDIWPSRQVWSLHRVGNTTL